MQTLKVLFVCLGNICRSPIAEAVFVNEINKLHLSTQFKVDSAGTSGFHIGSTPDYRAIAILQQQGITTNHHARQINSHDLDYYNYILVMDHLNYEEVISLANNKHDIAKRVFLLRSFDLEEKSNFNIPDPYYGLEDNFAEVFTICKRSISGFIHFLQQQGLVNLKTCKAEHTGIALC